MKMLSLVFCLLVFTPNLELTSVRKQYVDAATSEESADKFHGAFDEVTDSHADKTLVAYKAASMVLLAKYEGNLIKKTKLFNKGTELLDAVIKKDPNNYEARLIRLNIQDNVPWITGYTGEIKQDKAFIMKNYSYQTDDLKAFARAYIKQSKAFTDKEKTGF